MTALVFGGMAVALPAKAQQTPPVPTPSDAPATVALDVASCARVDATEVRRLFELELGQPVADTADDDGATVSIDCDGSTIVLRVRNDATDEELERRVELDSRPARGRERLLALAARELLLSTSWQPIDDESQESQADSRGNGANDSAANDRPADGGGDDSDRRVDATNVDDGLETAVGRESEGWSTVVFLLGAVTREDHGLAPGGGARLILDHASGLGGSFDIVGATGADDNPLGDISINSVTASAAMHARWSWRSLVARAAVGGRAGVVALSGEPAPDSGARGGDVNGLVAGPFARLHLGAEFESGLALDVSVEPGYHVSAVRGLVDGARQTTFEGLWLHAHVAAGWRW